MRNLNEIGQIGCAVLRADGHDDTDGWFQKLFFKTHPQIKLISNLTWWLYCF